MNLLKKFLSIVLLLSVISLTFERKKDNFESQKAIQIQDNNLAEEFGNEIYHCLDLNANATGLLGSIKGFSREGLSYENFAKSFDSEIGDNFTSEFLEEGENVFFYLDDGSFELNWHSFKLTCKYIMYEKDDAECREVNKILKKGYESVTGDKEKNITHAQGLKLSQFDFYNTIYDVLAYLKDKKDLQKEFLFNGFDVDNNKFISREEIGFDCEKTKDQTCERWKSSYEDFAAYLKDDLQVDSITYELGKANKAEIIEAFGELMVTGPKDFFNGFDDDKSGAIEEKEFLMDCPEKFAFDNEINKEICGKFSIFVKNIYGFLSDYAASQGFNGNQISDEHMEKIMTELESSKFNPFEENFLNFFFFYLDDNGNNILDKSDLEYKCGNQGPKAMLNAGIKKMKNGFH